MRSVCPRARRRPPDLFQGSAQLAKKVVRPDGANRERKTGKTQGKDHEHPVETGRAHDGTPL
ncbi:MAG: hypothetical protein ACC628_11965 [Pirellulaceae bacterium]